MARYLISLDAAVHADDAAATAAVTSVGATVEKTFSFPLTYEIGATAEQLAAIGGVLQSIERDAPISIELQVLNKDHLDYLVRRSSTDTTTMYDPVNRGAGQHVYLVDTGVRASHEQFASSIINNLFSAYAADPAVDDFDDTAGHGTAMAGVIVGADLGVVPEATLHNVKLYNTAGLVKVGDILDAFDAILLHHNSNSPAQPKAVCLPWTTAQNNFIDSKVAEMNNANLIVVASAGNDGVDVNTKSPAGVDAIITVGAFDRNYRVTSFTNSPWAAEPGTTVYNNYGAQLDIFALGVDVDTADFTDDTAYNTVSGTSISAALVAGVAVQYAARYTNKSAKDLKDIMLQEGHILGRELLVFDSDIDYSAVYKSIATTDNINTAQLTGLPSGRIVNVQNNTSATVNLLLNPDATDVAVLEFAPAPPFINVDTVTGIVNIDATALDPAANLVPGIYVFAIKGTIDSAIQVEEFTVGLYENDPAELDIATQYYYDTTTDTYDPVSEFLAGSSFANKN